MPLGAVRWSTSHTAASSGLQTARTGWAVRCMSCTGGSQGMGSTGQAARAVPSSSVQPKAVGLSPAAPVLGDLSE